MPSSRTTGSCSCGHGCTQQRQTSEIHCWFSDAVLYETLQQDSTRDALGAAADKVSVEAYITADSNLHNSQVCLDFWIDEVLCFMYVSTTAAT